MKKMFTKGLRTISLCLVLAMVLQLVPGAVFAEYAEPVGSQETTAPQEMLVNDESFHESRILAELNDRRDASHKTFLNEDYSETLVTYAEPVHYWDGTTYEDIDNSLTPAADGEDGLSVLENKNNDFKVKFAQDLNEKYLVKIVKGDYRISWDLKKAGTAAEPAAENESVFADAPVEVVPEAESTETGGNLSDVEKANLKWMTPEHLSATVRYDDIDAVTSLEYIVSADSIKENIHLTALPDNRSYVFKLVTKNLVAKQLADDTIVFADGETAVYTINPMFMVDANGVESRDIAVTLTDKGNGVYLLKVTPDRKWLKNAAYPVVIDPEVSVKEKTYRPQDTYVNSVSATTNYSTSTTQKVGVNTTATGINRGLVNLGTRPSMAIGDMVQRAKYYIYKTGGSTSQTQINLIPVTGSNITVSSANYSSWNNPNGTVADYVVTTANNSFYSFDITNMVRSWMNGSNDCSFALKANSETEGQYAEFASCKSVSAPSYYAITYIGSQGLEDYWSYVQSDAGRAGTGYVNEYNGNLVFVGPSVSTVGNLMTASVYPIYNSGYSDIRFATGTDGWRLNVQQLIELETLNGSVKVVKYIDEDGTKHYFQDVAVGASSTDTDGLGLTLNHLTRGGSDYYTLTDSADTVWEFSRGVSLEASTLGKYFLVSITQKDGQSISLRYNSTTVMGMVSDVIDASGKTIHLTYTSDDGNLTKIENTETGESLSMTYTTLSTGKRLLTCLTFKDGEKVYYAYTGSTNCLSQAKDIDGISVNYAYTNPDEQWRKVSQIAVKGSDGTTGDTLNFNNYTGASTELADGYGNRQQILFNHNGSVTGTTDLRAGCTDYRLATSNAYEYGANGGSKNKITLSADGQRSVVNLLPNGGVELDTNKLTLGSDKQDTAFTCSGGVDTTQKASGSRSYKLTAANSTNSRAWFATERTLPKGNQYTFSAYVKGDLSKYSNVEKESGAQLQLMYKNNAGAFVTAESEAVLLPNGWQRLSVTIDYPATATSGLTLRCSIARAYGTVYFDNLQLELGNVANYFNILEDGGFDNGGTAWVKSGHQTGDGVQTVPRGGNTAELAMKMVGKASSQSKNFYQDVQTPGGKENEFVTVSAWAKANAVPFRSAEDETRVPERVRFGITLWFIKAGQATKYERYDFNPDTTDWQYGSLSVAAPCAYDTIRVQLTYANNMNTVYFDDVSLRLEKVGTSYEYDDKGEVSTVTDAKNNTVDIEQGEDASGIETAEVDASTVAGKFFSRSDAKGRVVLDVSPDGTKSTTTYDSKGNATDSRTTIIGAATPTLVKDAAYYIKQVNSDYYWDMSGTTLVQTTYTGSTAQQFTLVNYKTNGGAVNLSPKSKTGQYLNFGDGAAIQLGTKQQSLYLTRQDDGTYGIKDTYGKWLGAYDYPDDDEKDSMTVGGEIRQIKTEPSTYDMRVVLIPVGGTDPTANQPYIGTSATYTADGRFPRRQYDENSGYIDTAYVTGAPWLVASTTNAASYATNYEYNATKTKLTRLTSQNSSVQYGYTKDALTSIATQTTTYAFGFDTFGRASSVKAGSRTLVSYKYNTYGQVETMTYGNGQIVGTTYDNAARITEVWFRQSENAAKQTLYTYAYDAGGDVCAFTDVNNSVTYTASWDADTNSATLVRSDGFKLTSSTSNDGKENRSGYIIDGTAYNGLTTFNDDTGRLSRFAFGGMVYAQEVDAFGRLIQTSQHSSSSGAGVVQVPVTTYNYKGSAITGTNDAADAKPQKTNIVRKMSTEYGFDWEHTRSFYYGYNSRSLISSVTEDSGKRTNYFYDGLDQLTQVTVPATGYQANYYYDNSGNLTSKKINGVTDTYTYGDSTWGDLLTAYNGQSITYDTIGNPTSYLGWTMTWTQGRTLKSMSKSGASLAFVYDSDGLRTKKTYNGVTTTYYRDGATILQEQRSDGTANLYSYGPDGRVVEASLGDQFVQYVYNAQGDVVMLLDDRGYVLAEYTYDAWGNITVTGDATLAKLNPFTYRGAYGYYYDWETGLYYLQSRYYDPQTCRFVNADWQLNNDVLGGNLFTYCENNPVASVDFNGKYSVDNALKYASKWWNGFNETKYYRYGQDCTNFISQCLYAGGVPMTGTGRNSGWHSYLTFKPVVVIPFVLTISKYVWDVSESWSVVAGLYKWLVNRGLTRYYIYNKDDLVKNIKNKTLRRGSVVFMCAKYNGILSHTIMIGRTTKTDAYYYAHSQARNAQSNEYGLVRYFNETPKGGRGCLVVINIL